MISTLLVVLPIFALVFAGWLAGRIGVLGPHATTELSRFVVYLALPTLMLDVVAHARWVDVWQPGFIAANGLSVAAVFGLTLAVRLRGSRHLADASIDGLNAAYANTGFIGFPLAVVAFGRDALPLVMIGSIITVCILTGSAIILIEIGLQTETRRSRLVMKVGRSLLRNPLLVAPVLGSLVPLAGLTVPAPAESFLKLLGGAASPCALVALGLFLAGRTGAAERDRRATAFLVGLKLVVQPLVAWVVASPILGLPPLPTHMAVLLAALPTGAGPFMLAEFYRREAGVTGDTVLVSTILSILTVSAYLALIQ